MVKDWMQNSCNILLLHFTSARPIDKSYSNRDTTVPQYVDTSYILAIREIAIHNKEIAGHYASVQHYLASMSRHPLYL